MLKTFCLEEEREDINDIGINNCEFVSFMDLDNLNCDILFILNKDLLKDFIKGIYYEKHNLLETERINFIIIKDLKLFNLIKDNYENIIDVKIEESWISGQNFKKLFNFFRIGDNKFHTVIKNFKRYYYIEDTNGEFTAIDGKKCSKCYDYYSEVKTHYEKDVNFMLRYSLLRVKNKRVKFSKNMRICTWDLESRASVDSVNTPEPIISLAANDSFTKEISYWDLKNIGTAEKPEYNLEEEKIMLESFFIYVSKFDILSGFNSSKFDCPYLINRAIKIGADTSLITGIENILPSAKFRGKESPMPWFVVIPGINVVDLMILADKVTGYLDTKLKDKKLETLGMAILGEGKTKDIATPAMLWANKDYENLKKYNIQDVNLTVGIDNKLGLIEMLFASLELVPGLNICDGVWNSKIIEFYLMSNFSDIIHPSINRDREAAVKGAIVLPTIPGIHEEVGVLDFQGMYPSLILSLNISFDTKTADGDININGVKFNSKKDGILVQLVRKYTELRKYYKEQKKLHEKMEDYKVWQLREFAVKKLLASMYGVCAFVGFRWFDNDVANAITGAGRNCLMFTKDICEKDGYEIVFADTDGMGVRKKEGFPNFEALEKKLNRSLFNWMRNFTLNKDVINNHKMIIENETVFKRVIFTTAKKTYIGIVTMSKGKKLDTPQLYGKGNFLIRKDTPDGMKNELSKIVMAVLNNSDKNNNIQIIKDKVVEIRKSLPNWGKDDLIIYKEINRNFADYKILPIHVKSAIASNKFLATKFSREDYKGGYVFVKSTKHPEVDALFMNDNTELTEDFKINYDKYFEKFIKQKILLTFGKKVCEQVFQENRLLSDF
jgi:DNA polymerase elongation subunit (family B)